MSFSIIVSIVDEISHDADKVHIKSLVGRIQFYFEWFSSKRNLTGANCAIKYSI
jgi:hypothetical protein